MVINCKMRSPLFRMIFLARDTYYLEIKPEELIGSLAEDFNTLNSHFTEYIYIYINR